MKTWHFTTILAATFILSACGRAPVRDTGEFTPFVEGFERESISQGNAVKIQDLVMKCGAMDQPSQRALCVKTPEQPNTILVNCPAWKSMTDQEKESLVFHELGHCSLNRHHLSTITDQGIPKSVMNPYMMEVETYSANRTYYLAELFRSQEADKPH